MNRIGHYEEALAMLSYPQQTYTMVNSNPSYGVLGDLITGLFTGVKTVADIRQQEKRGIAELEMQERMMQRQAITAATIEQKKAVLDAQKAKYMPLYIAGGIAVVGILGITVKQLLKPMK